LKKQSQFVTARFCAKSFVKGYYDKNPVLEAQKNKANSKPNKANFRPAAGQKRLKPSVK
jgi:hypothetical protein